MVGNSPTRTTAADRCFILVVAIDAMKNAATDGFRADQRSATAEFTCLESENWTRSRPKYEG